MVDHKDAIALTERRKEILRLVIQEYVRDALPVASETLVQQYPLGVSSATVRNEMAALEQLGLLTHPHTSAGRVPTDQGYRYFVEHLMEWQPLPFDQRRMIRHQFYQVRTDVEEWPRLAAASLARLAQGAAMVTPPRSPQPCFKHLELLAVYDTRVLLVLILQDGTVRQHMLTTEEALSQEELSTLAGRLRDHLEGLQVEQITRLLHSESWSRLESRILTLVQDTLEQADRCELEQFDQHGVLEALSQPEFSEVEHARQFLEILEQRRIISDLLGQALRQSGVQIIIGGESQREEMRHYSLVVSRYGLVGRMEGVLGVLGPTRMPYPRSVSAVHFMARLMGELLEQIHSRS